MKESVCFQVWLPRVNISFMLRVCVGVCMHCICLCACAPVVIFYVIMSVPHYLYAVSYQCDYVHTCVCLRVSVCV